MDSELDKLEPEVGRHAEALSLVNGHSFFYYHMKSYLIELAREEENAGEGKDFSTYITEVRAASILSFGIMMIMIMTITQLLHPDSKVSLQAQLLEMFRRFVQNQCSKDILHERRLLSQVKIGRSLAKRLNTARAAGKSCRKQALWIALER